MKEEIRSFSEKVKNIDLEANDIIEYQSITSTAVSKVGEIASRGVLKLIK